MDIGQPTIVFVTVCTKDRIPWLASPIVHESLVTIWRNAAAWTVGEYVVMPEHVHFFCAPNDVNVTLRAWVTYWKRSYTRLKVPGSGEWQRDCWDTRLRRSENYADKWAYVQANPVRKGLVSHVEDWPYRGRLNVLPW